MDADVLFAGAASATTHGASLVVLRMAEITLIEAFTSDQVIREVERNLQDKMPRAMPAFQLLAQRCLHVVPDPSPSDLTPHHGKAHPKDLPILVAALRKNCPWLLTFNLGDYQPGDPNVTVANPGVFVQRARQDLSVMR